MLSDLTSKVIVTLNKYNMLSGGEKVLIGLSGGPDSVCLLHVLNNLKTSYNLDLHTIYIDHGMRPEETPSEIKFCKLLSVRLGIPFYTKSVDVCSFSQQHGLNKQEAARHLRYMAYEETAREIRADRIALGHTADDQAETVLMRLFRGSGPTGLAGIPPQRRKIIRPLIEVKRKEIEKFLFDSGIDFVTDSSNLKKDYIRNKIRHSIIPIIRDLNPDIIETLSRTAAIFRDEERYFEIIVTKTLMKMISRKTDTRIELFLAPFEIMDKVIMRRVIRRIIDETKGLRGIGFFHIEEIIELIKNGKPGDRIYLPKGIRAIKEYSTIMLTAEAPVRLGNYTLTVPGENILKEAGIILKSSIVEGDETDRIKKNISGLWKTCAILDADKILFPLTVRARENGDFFYPSGFGKKKKLQDFFVDEKVPREERNRIPLLISGQDIAWVVGYRGDDRFKVTDGTKRILRLDVKKIRD